MTRDRSSLLGKAAAAAAVIGALAACTATPSPSRARSWLARDHETRTFARTTIAAAVVAPPPPPAVDAPAPSKPAVAPLAAPKRHGNAEVRLFTLDNADCPTEALGVVNERADDGDEGAAVERIKAKARGMGADAVVGYRTETHGTNGGTGLDLAGVAVRCKKLAEDRPYDVLGRIEVPVASDAASNDQDAFDELLARADKMHANLVLDVHVVPGQNGAHGKVVGAAIRYR